MVSQRVKHDGATKHTHIAFLMVQLSHPHMTTGETIASTRWTFVGKVMSLLFNMLSRFVIAFLSRSKHLLISWNVVKCRFWFSRSRWGLECCPTHKLPGNAELLVWDHSLSGWLRCLLGYCLHSFPNTLSKAMSVLSAESFASPMAWIRWPVVLVMQFEVPNTAAPFSLNRNPCQASSRALSD